MNAVDTVADPTPAQLALSNHLRLLTAGRIQEWVNLFAPDGILEFSYAPEGVPHRLQGHEELLAYMVHFPETFDVTVADLVFHQTVSPNLAIAEFRLTGRAIATDKPYEQTCISVVFGDDQGRITLYHDYWNPLVAIEALTPQRALSRSRMETNVMSTDRRRFMKKGSALIAAGVGVGTCMLQACGGGHEATEDPTADEHAERTPAQRALLSHLQLVSSGQIQEWVRLFADDGVLEFSYAPQGVPRRLQGQAELLAYMTHFPETFNVTFTDLVFHEMVDPNATVAEFRLTGRVIPTGKPYEQVCVSVLFTEAAGKIKHYKDYWNPLVAIEALTPAAG